MLVDYDRCDCNYVGRANRAETAIRAAVAMLDDRALDMDAKDVRRVVRLLRAGLPEAPRPSSAVEGL